MRRIMFGAAVAAALSIGGGRVALAQGSVWDRAAERAATAARNDGAAARFDSRWSDDRLDVYLRGISLDRNLRARVDREWDAPRSREDRLARVRALLSRDQQRRFDANRSEYERSVDRRANDDRSRARGATSDRDYDRSGYDRSGYDRGGYDRGGYDRTGRDRYGYDRNGFDRNGYDRNGYDRNGRDRNGRYARGRDRR
jgi:hypothetical protein